MKKVVFVMCLFAMVAANLNVMAQDITINLRPGWTWFSYPKAEAMGFSTALGDFAPMNGDMIKSQFGTAVYRNGIWRGGQGFNPGLGYMYYSSRTDDVELVFSYGSSSVTTAEPIDVSATSAVAGGTVMGPEGCHVFLRGVCWGTEPNPDIDINHTVNGTSFGDFNDTLVGLTPNTTYYVRAYTVTDYGLAYGEELSFTTDHEYVDLGLPSGTLWATSNVGANDSEEYGYYFAWGEIQPKDTYDWSTYQHCNGNSNMLTKYCNDSLCGYNGFSDRLTTLLPEDDAATANWGAEWRMPIKAEWEELFNNTTITWTTQNGVNGRLFTASNGNSLFLPAAGSSAAGNGSNGCYWSGSLDSSDPNNARNIDFSSASCSMSGLSRSYGLPVRPVRSTSQNNTTAPMGAVEGKFTINGSGAQVYFAQGNLQYIGSASTPYWKFAENQWECLGTTTGQNSDEPAVDRDLFGWGTSNWDCNNACYRPWDTYNLSGTSYGPGGSWNITGTFANSDWGVYNSISNGGNQPNLWRTLSKNEWVYVFDSRTTNSGIRFAKAVVNDMNGVILLPDNWNSAYYDLNETNTKDANFTSNVLSVSDWNYLERLGAVFLPAAGYRFGTTVREVGRRGHYWSSSMVNNNYAYGVYYYDSDDASDLNPMDCCNRSYGRGVRLVRVVE